MTIDREDILIGRVVSCEATGSDWNALEALAQDDEGVWKRLAQTQRDHDALTREVGDAVQAADRVDIPLRAAQASHGVRVRLRAWSGWAAAAALAIVWLGSLGMLGGPAPGVSSGENAASVMPASLTPEEAFDHYLFEGRERGQVLGELPKILVDSRLGADGAAVEVIYLRRIVERKTVDSVLTFDEDDAGEVRLAPATGRFMVTSEPM